MLGCKGRNVNSYVRNLAELTENENISKNPSTKHGHSENNFMIRWDKIRINLNLKHCFKFRLIRFNNSIIQ